MNAGPEAATTLRELLTGPPAPELLRIDGADHQLAIGAPLLGPEVTVAVDGQALGSLPKPTLHDPFSVGHWEVAGRQLTLALLPHRWPNRYWYSVLVDGRTADGQDLGAVRSLAPEPLSRFAASTEDWFFFRMSEMARRPVAPRWFAIWVTVLFGAMAGMVASRSVAPVLVGASLVVISVSSPVLSIRTWLVLLARSQQALARREDLPHTVRLIVLVAVFLASGVLMSVVGIGLLIGPAFLSDWLSRAR